MLVILFFIYQGIISKDFALSDIIIRGKWTITAVYGHQVFHLSQLLLLLFCALTYFPRDLSLARLRYVSIYPWIIPGTGTYMLLSWLAKVAIYGHLVRKGLMFILISSPF